MFNSEGQFIHCIQPHSCHIAGPPPPPPPPPPHPPTHPPLCSDTLGDFISLYHAWGRGREPQAKIVYFRLGQLYVHACLVLSESSCPASIHRYSTKMCMHVCLIKAGVGVIKELARYKIMIQQYSEYIGQHTGMLAWHACPIVLQCKCDVEITIK